MQTQVSAEQGLSVYLFLCVCIEKDMHSKMLNDSRGSGYFYLAFLHLYFQSFIQWIYNKGEKKFLTQGLIQVTDVSLAKNRVFIHLTCGCLEANVIQLPWSKKPTLFSPGAARASPRSWEGVLGLWVAHRWPHHERQWLYILVYCFSSISMLV